MTKFERLVVLVLTLGILRPCLPSPYSRHTAQREINQLAATAELKPMIVSTLTSSKISLTALEASL
jgi:hypothetical protein